MKLTPTLNMNQQQAAEYYNHLTSLLGLRYMRVMCTGFALDIGILIHRNIGGSRFMWELVYVYLNQSLF